MRFAPEHQNPLVAGAVSGNSGLPATSFSLLSLSNQDVILWALKPAEDNPGQMFIARLWNLAGGSATCSLTMTNAPLQAAWQVSHIETIQSRLTLASGSLNESFNAQQIRTFQLSTSPDYPVFIPLVIAS
jgi:alpha-mannosidase